jgi:hypothetical protein
MELIVDSKRTEQVKIFAQLKALYASSGTSRNFKRLKHVPFTLPIERWEESLFNQFHDTKYFKIYCRNIDGHLRWLAVANKTGRQYVMEMK